jgi:hypothetical protein
MTYDRVKKERGIVVLAIGIVLYTREPMILFTGAFSYACERSWWPGKCSAVPGTKLFVLITTFLQNTPGLSDPDD